MNQPLMQNKLFHYKLALTARVLVAVAGKLTSCPVLGEGNEMDATVGISVLGIFSGVHVSAILGLTPVCGELQEDIEM